MYKRYIEPVMETAQEIVLPSTADVSDEKSQPKKKDVRDYPNYVIPPYTITPLMSFNDDIVNMRLSLRRNALLSEHWNAYLCTKPPPTARFQLYREILNKSRNPLPRRFSSWKLEYKSQL
ncbi:uncharacterized protein LOC119676660 [Teleopsis dalmanni]|uniref:uncharacterized protein LOC119676660 n=1 Tax=Teleopsis dalmanni TaxID=139649 RepID=UPI0018CCB0DF|nr:uncharacterized protein LOC119676660 [Teleopsis dalmanni]